jgi:hypothetical protein
MWVSCGGGREMSRCERDFVLHGRGSAGLRRGGKSAPTAAVVLSQPEFPSNMASALLRRQLAHKIALPRRCLFSSTSSVLAQAAPQSESSSTSSSTTATPGGGGKNVFNRHIAEELQGVTASEILAESGTRKDAQMRHFTGEWICLLFFCLAVGLTIVPLLPQLISGALVLEKFRLVHSH